MDLASLVDEYLKYGLGGLIGLIVTGIVQPVNHALRTYFDNPNTAAAIGSSISIGLIIALGYIRILQTRTEYDVEELEAEFDYGGLSPRMMLNPHSRSVVNVTTHEIGYIGITVGGAIGGILGGLVGLTGAFIGGVAGAVIGDYLLHKYLRTTL